MKNITTTASPLTVVETASPLTVAETASPLTVAETASPLTVAETASPLTVAAVTIYGKKLIPIFNKLNIPYELTCSKYSDTFDITTTAEKCNDLFSNIAAADYDINIPKLYHIRFGTFGNYIGFGYGAAACTVLVTVKKEEGENA